MDRPPWLDAAARNRLVDEAIEHYVEWREECAAVEAAYCSWSSGPAIARALSFASYNAALDREECAAHAYAAAVNAVTRMIWPDPATRPLAFQSSVTDAPAL